MIDARFSARAFAKYGLGTKAARRLADKLQDQVQKEMDKVIVPHFQGIIEKLNRMGHNLRPYEDPKPGDIAYRDDAIDESGYKCKLRVAFDSVVSAGYAHYTPLRTEPEADYWSSRKRGAKGKA